MGISTAVLERAGFLQVDPEEFDRLVADALEEVVPLGAHRRTRPRSCRTPSWPCWPRMRFDPLPVGLRRTRWSGTARSMLPGSRRACPWPRRAAHWGWPRAALRQRLGERTLYGIKGPAGWRLPWFQFAAQVPRGAPCRASSGCCLAWRHESIPGRQAGR